MQHINKNLSIDNLIRNSLLVFLGTLKKSLNMSIESTLKDIFTQAKNATSNQQETALFEEYNNLKNSYKILVNTLVIKTNDMPDQITQQISEGQKEIVLSIVEQEDLEISLALTQLESVLDIKFAKYLFALEKRLKILFASKNITKLNMPLGTSSICWILNRTIEVSKTTTTTKVLLLEHLKKALSENLLYTYKKIDGLFIQAGILPNIQLETKKATSDEKIKSLSKESDLNSTSSSQQTFSNSNALNENNLNKQSEEINQKSADLVSSIFNLMNQGRTQNTLNNETQAASINNYTMDQALENLSKTTSVAAGSIEVDKLKEMILDNVRNETGVYYPSLTTQQQNSLDVMGMFYDQVKTDIHIDNNILSSLNAINIPLIRTAINDQSFLDDNSHPARRYLETIISSAQKWHGTQIVKEIHKYSANIASDFDGTSQSFIEANEIIDSFLRLTERRSKKSEEKWIKASQGKEKLDVSRHKVEKIINTISETAVPVFVKNVIKYVIQDSMTLSLLRHGENSDEWHRNINTSESIAKMANSDTINELTPKQKIESLHHLDQTMDKLGFSENDRSKTINNLKECAQAASDKTLNEGIKLSEVTTINKHKQNVRKAGSKKIEELRPLTAPEKTLLSKVKLMPYGTLFDFITNQQRDKTRRKLSWFSPVSNKALFVTLLGKKPYEISLNAIAIDLGRNNIIIVKLENKKYFDKVLGLILSKLKGLAN